MHGSKVVEPFSYAYYLFGYLYRFCIFRISTGNKRIGIAGLYHHHTEVIAVEHFLYRFLVGNTFALPFVSEDTCITQAATFFVGMAQIYYFKTIEIYTDRSCEFAYIFVISQQYGLAYILSQCCDRGTQHVGMVGLCKNDSLARRILSLFIDMTQHLVIVAHKYAQLVLVGFPIGDRMPGNARVHSSSCYGRCYGNEQARVERFGYNVVGAEFDAIQPVSGVYYIGNRLFGQRCDGIYGRQFHLFIYSGSPGVEGAPEDVWKSYHVIDLVRIIGAAGGKYQVGTRSLGFLIRYLGIGICQGKDNRTLVHRLYHLGRQHIGDRQPQEYIGSNHSLGQRRYVAVCGKFGFCSIQVGPALGNDTLAVYHDNIFGSNA